VNLTRMEVDDVLAQIIDQRLKVRRAANLEIDVQELNVG
jgi:hypothetical protein